MVRLKNSAQTEALRGLQSSVEVISGREIHKHNKLFNLNRLGNRTLIGAALMIEPAGIEIASGHLFCTQAKARWCFLQDFQGRTMFGTGVENFDRGHRIKVDLNCDITKDKPGQRLINIASRMNWMMTQVAVGDQRRWQDAMSNLPSDLAPVEIGHSAAMPTLMSAAFYVSDDDGYRELIAELASADISDLYKAYRRGRTYRTPYEGIAHISVNEDGVTEIQIDPVHEEVRKPLIYQLVPSVAKVLVEEGQTVDAGSAIFDLFPRDEFMPVGKYANSDVEQMEELDGAFGIDAINALNHLHFINETVVYSEDRKRIAVPFRSALRLSEAVLQKYVPSTEAWNANLIYDLTPVADRANDDTHAYLLLPTRAASVRGHRWLGDIMLDVEVKVG